MAYRVQVGRDAQGRPRYCHTRNCKRHAKLLATGPSFERDVLLHRPVRAEPVWDAVTVLQHVPDGQRLAITPEQLTRVFRVMQNFGTPADDEDGFRAYISRKTGFSSMWEWTEHRGGARYTQSVDLTGKVRAVSLNQYGSGHYQYEPRFLDGQARLRRIFDLEPYSEWDREHIAEQYWNSCIRTLTTFATVDEARLARQAYIAAKAAQPKVTQAMVEAWGAQPEHHIGPTEADAQLYIKLMLPRNHGGSGQEMQPQLLLSMKNREKSRFVNILGHASDAVMPRMVYHALMAWQRKYFPKPT